MHWRVSKFVVVVPNSEPRRVSYMTRPTKHAHGRWTGNYPTGHLVEFCLGRSCITFLATGGLLWMCGSCVGVGSLRSYCCYCLLRTLLLSSLFVMHEWKYIKQTPPTGNLRGSSVAALVTHRTIQQTSNTPKQKTLTRIAHGIDHDHAPATANTQMVHPVNNLLVHGLIVVTVNSIYVEYMPVVRGVAGNAIDIRDCFGYGFSFLCVPV